LTIVVLLQKLWILAIRWRSQTLSCIPLVMFLVVLTVQPLSYNKSGINDCIAHEHHDTDWYTQGFIQWGGGDVPQAWTWHGGDIPHQLEFFGNFFLVLKI
jgi:hypothetical protein